MSSPGILLRPSDFKADVFSVQSANNLGMQKSFFSLYKQGKNCQNYKMYRKRLIDKFEYIHIN